MSDTLYDNLSSPRNMVAKTRKNIEIHTIEYEEITKLYILQTYNLFIMKHGNNNKNA